jgi:hypothetical protein
MKLLRTEANGGLLAAISSSRQRRRRDVMLARYSL